MEFNEKFPRPTPFIKVFLPADVPIEWDVPPETPVDPTLPPIEADADATPIPPVDTVSYTHLRAHET